MNVRTGEPAPGLRSRFCLAAALVVHLTLVTSVTRQPLDAHVPAVSPRFLTAQLYLDAAIWPGPGGDFFALYHGGLKVRRGESPHDLTRAEGDPPYFFRYIYSPLLAQSAGRLVTLLPPRWAYKAWVLVIELMLFGWLLVIWRHPAPIGTRVFAICILLLSQPYVLELHMGQFTFAAVSLAMASAWIASRARPRLTASAALLFAATLLKTFPLVTLAAYVRKRRAWPAAAGGALAAVVVLVSGLVGGRTGHVALGTLDSVGVPHPGAEGLVQALFVAVLAVSGRWLPTVLPLLPGLLLVFSLGAAGYLVVRRPELGLVRGAAAMVLAFFLGYQHAWEHHYAAVILAGTLAFVDGGHSQDSRPAPEDILLPIALVFLALPSPFLIVGPRFEAWPVGAWLLMSLSKGVPAAAALYALLRLSAPPRAGRPASA